MFCRSAFKQNYPPDGFMELASEVASLAGNLPLGLNVLSSYLRGREEEDWMDMMPRLRKSLDGKIEKTLRVSYDGLNNKKDKAIFRHIACLFSGEEVNDIKLLLADSELDVNIGLKNLVDKSLVKVSDGTVDVHGLLQKMCKEIVCTQSSEPGEREFLVDSKDVCNVLENNTGTKNVLGISLNMDETDELHIRGDAFKGMSNLLFLNFFSSREKEVPLHLSEGFGQFSPKLRLLYWDEYPLKFMPSKFQPQNLVKLQMWKSKLEKLWDGVHPLIGLKEMDMYASHNLKEIPDLSMAINLEKLDLSHCSSLVELPCSIQYLQRLRDLQLAYCKNLETLPTGVNLESLYKLNLKGCTLLRKFPDISTNMSKLYIDKTGIEEIPCNVHLENLYDLKMRGMSDKLWDKVQPLTQLMTMLSPFLERLVLSDIPSLVELPSSFKNLNQLEDLRITDCKNLEIIPMELKLECLTSLDFKGCSKLKTFPDISTNISWLDLSRTAIHEVPWWIEKYSSLEHLLLNGCNNLQSVSIELSKLEHIKEVEFSDCWALTEATLNDIPNALPLAMRKASFKFNNCFNLDQEALLQQESVFYKSIQLPGEEVPSYFTHCCTTGTSLTNIPLLERAPSQQVFIFRVCAVVSNSAPRFGSNGVDIQVNCRFKGRFENSFDSVGEPQRFWVPMKDSHLLIFGCCIPLNKDTSAPLAQLNYEHVDIQIHLGNTRIYLEGPKAPISNFMLKGWGIRLLEDCSSPENPNNLPQYVCEAEEHNMGYETERSEESVDSNVETERSKKRMRIV
ncbi:hypothetical protein CARUB_v10028683mg [Capsella rubella]|uniref:Disease resistance protein Roq1-like winged-helix domain-containing protein n=2 Tax=Capsella rubella TaxID=81985 RepID=R0GVS0_9BRAS|nr:hypothetical protein CARUB_v10028683mg [Capsella rubella]EOA15283.1 hypothetical protein CARUB_v10028683mg [Capsella rubella]